MNLLSAYTAYPLPAAYSSGQAARSPNRQEGAADPAIRPAAAATGAEFLPARPDTDELEREARQPLPDNTPYEIRTFLSTAAAGPESRLGRFVDIKA